MPIAKWNTSINCRVVVTEAMAAVDFSEKLKNIQYQRAYFHRYADRFSFLDHSDWKFIFGFRKRAAAGKKNKKQFRMSPRKLIHGFIRDANF